MVTKLQATTETLGDTDRLLVIDHTQADSSSFEVRTMNKQVLGLFLALAVLLGLGCVPASAQLVSGSLTGNVLDATGASVPNATVVAHNDATGVETTTTSTSAGEYHIYNLPVGTYTISATAKGFSKSEI